LLRRRGSDDVVVLQDEGSPFGYFIREVPDSPVLADEGSPEFAEEMRRRLESPHPALSAEAFQTFLRSQERQPS
jgi:hypothetical protein